MFGRQPSAQTALLPHRRTWPAPGAAPAPNPRHQFLHSFFLKGAGFPKSNRAFDREFGIDAPVRTHDSADVKPAYCVSSPIGPLKLGLGLGAMRSSSSGTFPAAGSAPQIDPVDELRSFP